MMTCQLLSPVSVCFFVLRGPPPSPCQGLPQSPTGIMHHLVMKGLSNGSFLYPSLTKLEWQLFPLPIPDFILSLSGSEYILSEWISLEALVCVFSHVFSFLFSSLLHLPLLTAHELGHIFGCYQGEHGLSLTPKEYCVAITKPDRMRWKSKRPCWSLLNRQITRALLSFTYLLMGTTCSDAVCVCFLETLLTFKQEKTIPVPAGRWLTWEPL